MKIAVRPVALAALLGLSAMSASDGAAQTPALGRLMREKLAHSEKVLEAIMTSDYASLQRHSEDLIRVTESPVWSVLKSPEYIRHSAAFLRATQDLVKAAADRDFDAATMHYVSLTLSCYQCHRYIKNRRIAGQ